MTIISNYRESKSKQFEMEILGEDEENYLVRLLPKYQPQFQEGDKVTKLRKCLVGDRDNLYSFKHHSEAIQLTLF